MQLHFIITGLVQGVSFRYYAKKVAVKLGITGWICNKSNGTLEIVAEGNEDVLKEFLGWCRNGPEHASVTDVKAKWKEGKNEFKEFSVRL